MGCNRVHRRVRHRPHPAAGNLPDPSTSIDSQQPQPRVGDELSSSLIGGNDRYDFQRAVASSAARYGIVAAVNQDCMGCDAMLDALEDLGSPDGVPMGAISWVSDREHHQRLENVFDMVTADPTGERSRAAGIKTTPFMLVVDEQLDVQIAQPGGDVYQVIDVWRMRSRSPVGGSPALETSSGVQVS